MGSLLFNKMAAGALTLALVGVGGSEIWRRTSGTGQDHSAASAAAPHAAESAMAPGATPAPATAEAQPAEGVPIAEGAVFPEAASGATSASEVGAAAATESAAQPVAEATPPPPPVPAGPDYAALFAAASIEEGKGLSNKCTMCHDMSEAQKTLMGPPLYGLFGRDIASTPGYTFTTGPGSLSNVAGTWDAARLDSFLENPKQIAPGTIMVFPGIKKEGERIALMSYMRSLTAGEPAPVP